jgi:hypothetical protein
MKSSGTMGLKTIRTHISMKLLDTGLAKLSAGLFLKTMASNKWRQIMDDSQFKTLMAVLARIADSLDAVIKLAEAINDRVDDCNDNLMSVSKNTW